ncbi:MAG: AAA family ATPase [Bdellovibrionales bacterium]
MQSPSFQLTPDQQKAVDAACGKPGYQGENVFINGPAGTGKTSVTNLITAELLKKFNSPSAVCRVAPTHGATQNLKEVGVFMTFPKLFRTFPCDTVKHAPAVHPSASVAERLRVEAQLRDDHWKKVRAKAARKFGKGPDYFTEQIRSFRAIHIDEISMLSGRQLEAAEYVCREATGRMDVLFGGIQVILTGDAAQLPTVQTKDMKHDMFYPLAPGESPKPFYKAVFRLHSRSGGGGAATRDVSFDDAFKSFPLWINFRVTPEDLWMRYLLDHVRYGKLDDLSMEIIKEMMTPLEWRLNVNLPAGITPPMIHTRNDAVRAENDAHLNALSTPLHVVKARDIIPTDFENVRMMISKELDQRLNGEPARFKVGMTVVLKENINPDAGLYNGATGVITKITFPREGFADATTIHGKPAVYVDFTTRPGLEPVPIGAVTHEYRHSEKVIAKRTAVPLEGGVSGTAHCWQGRSLDTGRVDLGACFAPGQMYTMLSRARNWERMLITRFNPRSLMCDTERAAKEIAEMPAEARAEREKLFAAVRALGRPRIPRKPEFEDAEHKPNIVQSASAQAEPPMPMEVEPEPEPEPAGLLENGQGQAKMFLFMCDNDYQDPVAAVRVMEAVTSQITQSNAWVFKYIVTTCENQGVLAELDKFARRAGCKITHFPPSKLMGPESPEDNYATFAGEFIDAMFVVTTPGTCRLPLYQKVCMKLHGMGKIVQMQTAAPKK